MTPGCAAVLNLVIALAGAISYFLVGFLWSASTWHRSFDLGWLVVAFIITRYASTRIERGRLHTREYVNLCVPALPGFGFEFFADLGLRDFRLHDGPGAVVCFAVFSCFLLLFIVALTTFLPFGIGLDTIATKDEAIWHGTTLVGAAAVIVSIVVGTALIFAKSARELNALVGILQSWLYCVSLIVYFLLTLKMMLPLVLNRLRIVVDQFNQPDMRF